MAGNHPLPNYTHEPVLYQAVLTALHPASGKRFIDCTIGGGGHAWGILQASSPDGQLLGIDADPTTLQIAGNRLEIFGPRVTLAHSNFCDLEQVARQNNFYPVHGVLFDLGISSIQLEDAVRGFSFQRDGPLDMRMNPNLSRSAADLVNDLPVEELADLIWRYGEERHSRRIARAIAAARPLSTTGELAGVVARVVGRRGRIHPATRTFQALRIAVNDELGALESVLPQAVRVLAPGGRVAVISFHSLEDRAVKIFFKREAQDCICPPQMPVCSCGHKASLQIVTSRPLVPSDEEKTRNPRSRSAKLRVAEKL
ncbi:MAG: 16S rRNA (cytosine(1402)-N(4))-methyltransferase [Anaerolineaceae bacterium 4572_32.1]|nr:MAG: 16S rRNA (cytosine(1402)-N(4))-methyltransferase [Anaerolineaceae bacterium 4572_32.1]